MILHRLNGCAPTPLAHYLKALGILRLVSEQPDPEARGWWEGERFLLATHLDEDELLDFFLEEYEPTPLFNPWGARSGYFPGSSESSARKVLEAIETSGRDRFASFKDIINCVREILKTTTGGKKPGDKDGKELLIRTLRNSVRGKSQLWMNTVVGIVSMSTKELEFPALFGTGGSEGSGSYTSAYMAAIGEALIDRRWDHAIRVSILGGVGVPGCSWDQSMGQYLPSGSASPWDLLLAFEGACVVHSSVSSRSLTAGQRWLSSPFYVANSPYGYPSGARQDQFMMNKGKELPGRGEQWFPLWHRPLLFSDLEKIFIAGRAATKRSRAVDGWSMARAIATRGVDAGIDEFIRYGYQQRNNLATHFAIPLGRFRVPDYVVPSLACLDDLDTWLTRLRRAARDRGATNRLRMNERRLSDALFVLVQHPGVSAHWQAVMLALADVEVVLLNSGNVRCGPIPPLRSEWVSAADDGSPEWRLAVALALQARALRRDDKTPIDSVRRHWVPSKNQESAAVMQGRRGIDDAIALVERRLIEAAQTGMRTLPLVSAIKAHASEADLAALLAGEADLNRTLTLARPLMAVKGREWAQHPQAISRPPVTRWPDEGWMAIRLAMLPWSLPDGRTIGVDPAILRWLESGDAATAIQLALRRLHAAGVSATVRFGYVPPDMARLWAAAIAFPIQRRTAELMVRRLELQSIEN